MGACYDDDSVTFIPYLSAYCGASPAWQPAIVITYCLWVCVLFSLLSTTADRHFVPQLRWLSALLRLRPEIAGITLLAFGNGAPDIFTAMAGIDGAGEFDLVLGEMLGASNFISTVVLASVLLATRPSAGGGGVALDRAEFSRDLAAYLVTVLTMLGVSLDGEVTLLEALALPAVYLAYVGAVVYQSRAAGADARAVLLEGGGGEAASSSAAAPLPAKAAAEPPIVLHGVLMPKVHEPPRVAMHHAQHYRRFSIVQ